MTTEQALTALRGGYGVRRKSWEQGTCITYEVRLSFRTKTYFWDRTHKDPVNQVDLTTFLNEAKDADDWEVIGHPDAPAAWHPMPPTHKFMRELEA
jgi:hypothetical protein